MRQRDRGRLIGLAIVLALASFVSQVPHIEAGTTLQLDGSGSGSSVGGNCVWSQKLTTLNGPDVIVAMLAINDTTTTVTPPSDTASLSWTFRASQTGPGNVQIVYYYAIAPAPLPADSVTFGLSSASVATVCLDFGVSGANTNAPFDPNVGMPDKNSGLSTTATLKYNTSNPNDLLMVLEGFCAQGAAGSGSPSGFSLVNAGNVRSSSNCPADGFQSATYSEIVSTTQSSSDVSWPFDTAVSPFAVIGDAIQSAPGPLSASVTAGSNAVDVGQLASFSCAGAGGVPPYTYSWTFDDGSTGSGASTTHIYSTPGTMNVACTVTDALGTTADGAVQLTVNPRTTLTSVSCADPFITNRGSTCRVTVTDNSPGTFITPTGTVGLSQTGVTGTFTACILVGTLASATCNSTFTASATGTATISASYPGDSTHTSSSDTESIAVGSALSITSFTASLANVDAGEKVTFTVTTSGGYEALSYSYANLPAGCLSTNTTTLSCYPSSMGNYRVTVTVTDRAMESANATTVLTVGPQRVLGLPQTMGLAVIFGAVVGIGAVLILSIFLTLRRKRRPPALTTG